MKRLFPLFVLLLAVSLLAACGKKGDPQPPQRTHVPGQHREG